MFLPVPQQLMQLTGSADVAEAVETLADRALGKLGEFDGPTPLEALASLLGVRSIERQAIPFEGALIPHAEGGYEIVVSDESQYARSRFSVAHELGHAVVNDLLDIRDFKHRTVFTAPGSRAEERVCDMFAAAILMPRRPFLRHFSSRPIGLELVRDVAAWFHVSFSAAAYRCAELLNVEDFGVGVFLEASGALQVRDIVKRFRRRSRNGVFGFTVPADQVVPDGFRGCNQMWLPESNTKRFLARIEAERFGTSDRYICLVAGQRDRIEARA